MTISTLTINTLWQKSWIVSTKASMFLLLLRLYLSRSKRLLWRVGQTLRIPSTTSITNTLLIIFLSKVLTSWINCTINSMYCGDRTL